MCFPAVRRVSRGASGRPNLDILAVIHCDLRLVLQTAIQATLKDRAPTIRENLAIETAGAMQRLNLVVHQLSELDQDTGLLPVIFQEIGPPMSAAETTLDVLTLHAHQP